MQPDRSTSTAEREATDEELEAWVHAAKRTVQESFDRIGSALAQLRDRKVYRKRGFDTFEAYVEERMGISRSQADRLMAGAATFRILDDNLSPGRQNGTKVLPTTERQVRPLRQLARENPQLAAETWQETVAEHGPDPTAAQVTEKVVKVYGSLQKSSEPKPRRSLQGALDRGTAQAGRLRSRVTERVAREAPTSVLDSYAPPSQVASVVMEPIEPTLRTFRQMLDLMQAWLTPSEQAGIAALVEDEGALQAYIRRLDGLLGAAHQVRDALESGQF